MIRNAILNDIDKILKITKSCTQYMITQGIYQWNPEYPNRSAFINDVARNELYVMEIENTIIACIVISSFMDKEYIPIQWLTQNNNAIYIHRFAVHPNYQGKGYAQQLMDFAEKFAIKNGYESIRLDTFSKNKRNQKFYKLGAYKKTGAIYFPKQSKHPFYCYELIL